LKSLAPAGRGSIEISFFDYGPAYVILIVSRAEKKHSLLAVRGSKGASEQGVKKIFDLQWNLKSKIFSRAESPLGVLLLLFSAKKRRFS